MSTNQWAIGIDLGGTKIEVALVNSSGIVRDRLRLPTESQQGYKAVLKRIAGTVRQLSEQNGDAAPSSIGIGVPGQISKSSGIVHYAPNLDWHEVEIEADLSAMLDKHVRVCNDVKAATWGEWYFGAGKDCDDFVCIFIGTGIGGGIVSGGHMLVGCNNTAGEIGHMTIDMHGPECHCGNKGCFESLAGGWAIKRDAQAMIEANKDAGKLMLSLVGNDISKVTARTVAEAVQKKDILAGKIVDDLANAIIAGSSAIINTLGPCRLIFGGGVIEGMPQLLDQVKKGVKKNALKASTKGIGIFHAKLHNDSGVIGAAAFSLDSWNKTQNLHSKDYEKKG